MRMLLIAPFAIVGIVLFAALGGYLVRQLWNWLLPSLFGWPRVTFWQALGLLVLCRILFGGLGFRGSRSRPPIAERWKHMTPEQRDRFRRGMWGRLGFAPTSEDPEQGGARL